MQLALKVLIWLVCLALVLGMAGFISMAVYMVCSRNKASTEFEQRFRGVRSNQLGRKQERDNAKR